MGKIPVELSEHYRAEALREVLELIEKIKFDSPEIEPGVCNLIIYYVELKAKVQELLDHDSGLSEGERLARFWKTGTSEPTKAAEMIDHDGGNPQVLNGGRSDD